MSYEFWAIIGVGAVIVYTIIVAASENEKRLDRIAALLARANELADHGAP